MDVQVELGGELFVWDATKAEENERKHGVRLGEAATVFHDPYFKFADASRSDEARYAAIGFDANARLLFVVHLEIANQSIRIISARRASPSEESLYVE